MSETFRSSEWCINISLYVKFFWNKAAGSFSALFTVLSLSFIRAKGQKTVRSRLWAGCDRL